MAGRGTDILLGGNAEFMARQQCLAEESRRAAAARRKRASSTTSEFVYFFTSTSSTACRAPSTTRSSRRSKAQCDAEHDAVVAARRPAHRRHRAARIAAHRQPAARPRRPPGRSRLVALLPVARRRPDAHLRLREHPRADAAPRAWKTACRSSTRWSPRPSPRAQKQVEAQNFCIRKHLLEYDDVMNKQRENVYALRRQLLEGEDPSRGRAEPVDTQGYLLTVAEDVLANTVDEYARRTAIASDWDLAGLKDRVEDVFGLDGSLLEELDEPGLRNEAIADTRVDQRHRGLPREGGDGRPRAAPRPGRRPAAARARGAPRARS